VSDEASNAGESARREHERRKAKEKAQREAEWGRLAGFVGALTPEKQSTKAWSSGAAGEAAVGARLDGLASESIRVMHDRRIPRSKANIDHIVVTPGGVWVIDTKRYVGPAPEKRVEGGIIRPCLVHTSTYLIGGGCGSHRGPRPDDCSPPPHDVLHRAHVNIPFAVRACAS
jgi:hypothetical protein